MRNLLRCRRGSAASIRRRAGATDWSGRTRGRGGIVVRHQATRAECRRYGSLFGRHTGGVFDLRSNGCDTAQDYIYRGKQFADQNKFCDPLTPLLYPCVNSPPTGTTHTVEIKRGTFAANAWTDSPTGSFVLANVSQRQPTTGLARSAWLVDCRHRREQPCQSARSGEAAVRLGIVGSISFTGSANIDAPTCGMTSNSTAASALNFLAHGITPDNVGSLSTAGGCTGSTTLCSTALTYMPAPIPNPFSALDGSLTALCGANPSLPARCGLPVCPGI